MPILHSRLFIQRSFIEDEDVIDDALEQWKTTLATITLSNSAK